MKKIIMLLLSVVLVLCFVGCSGKNDIKYESASITASFVGYGKGTKMEVVFSYEDVSSVLAILNDSKWDKSLCKCGYEYTLRLGESTLYYSYKQGIINDYENDRNLKLSDEDKAYLNSVILEGLEYKSSSIYIRQTTGDSASLSEKLEDKDVQKVLSILNSGAWVESLTNCTVWGDFQLDGFNLVYSSSGVISDYLHGRSLMLSQQDHQYIDELFYKLEERDKSWTWAIDETTGDRLVKYEYNNGTLVFKRYYAFEIVYNHEYSFAGLEEVAYEKYYYEGGLLDKFEFYSRGYAEEDYMPLALQYTGYFEYGYEDEFPDNEARICWMQVYVEHSETNSVDEYYYNSDGELMKIDKFDSGALSYAITYESGRPSGFIKDEKTIVPIYDDNGNMTSLAAGDNSLVVEYSENMPAKITLERGGESVTAELVFDGKNRLESTRLTVGDTCYSAKYSYDIASFEEKVVGYKSEKGNDPVEVLWGTKRYYANDTLAYSYCKTTDGEANEKWVETVVECESVNANGVTNILHFSRTSSEDKNGGTSGQIEYRDWKNKFPVKKDFLYDDGTKQSFEYHYSKNGYLMVILDLVSGDRYDFDNDEYGNVLSYTAPGEYYEYKYIDSYNTLARFDRTHFSYFDKEAYVKKKEVKGWGTLKCVFDRSMKVSEQFESYDQSNGYKIKWQYNGNLESYEKWECLRIGGELLDIYRIREEYYSNGELKLRHTMDRNRIKEEEFSAGIIRCISIYNLSGGLLEKIEYENGLEKSHTYYFGSPTQMIDQHKSVYFTYELFDDGRIKRKTAKNINGTIFDEFIYCIEINSLGEECYYLAESRSYDSYRNITVKEYTYIGDGETYLSRETKSDITGNVIYEKRFDKNGNELN